MTKRLTRREISEGLKTVPIESLLIGVNNPAGIKLTAKQKRFAEEIVKGNTKAGAYRAAYPDSKAKPAVQSVEGHRLMANPKVSLQIDAMRLALERQKYTTPAALRALVIDQLVEKVLDPEVKPAQQLKALHLLGTVTEVAAFTERKTIEHTGTDSESIRGRLLETIRAALKVDAIDVETIEGDDLLAEIKSARAEPPADADSTPADPTRTPPPADDSTDPQSTMHTIPHSQSPLESKPHLPVETGAVLAEKEDTETT
jgi:phage terminase small subunit